MVGEREEERGEGENERLAAGVCELNKRKVTNLTKIPTTSSSGFAKKLQKTKKKTQHANDKSCYAWLHMNIAEQQAMPLQHHGKGKCQKENIKI